MAKIKIRDDFMISWQLVLAYHLQQELCDYLQTSNISGTLVDIKIVDHSDAVGASPVGAAPTTSSFSI